MVQTHGSSQTGAQAVSAELALGDRAASGSLTEIPILDLGDFLAGKPGAHDATAAQLRWALENIGFFYIRGHGIAESMIERIFAETRRFHGQPDDEKMKIHLNSSNRGYMPLRGHAQRHSALNKNPKPNENESFFAKREQDPNDPAVKAGKPFRGPNQWPDDLPGFRETVLDYHGTMSELAYRMLPLYARSLGLADDHFKPAFGKGGEITVRMIHYPQATEEHVRENVFGTAAHTDRNLFTILAPGDTPGLQIMMPGGQWLEAPLVPGTFVVNAGDTLRRWTNDRYLSTPHRVLNMSGRDRYSVAFFVATDFEAMIECLPTCQSAERPALYPPVLYETMFTEFVSANYANQQAGHAKIA